MVRSTIKNLSILTLITLLTGSSFLAQSASATTQTADGEPVWLVEDLIVESNKMKIERDNECGNDDACRRSLYEKQIMRGGVYSAVGSMEKEIFLLTSVTALDGGKIKMVFHDKDIRHWLEYGEKVEHQIRRMHIIALAENINPWADQCAIDVNSYGVDKEGCAWFIYGTWLDIEASQSLTSDSEIELQSLYRDYHLASYPRLFVEFLSDGDWMHSEIIDYSACGESLWNSECILVYDETGNRRYVPKMSLVEPSAVVAEEPDVLEPETNGIDPRTEIEEPVNNGGNGETIENPVNNDENEETVENTIANTNTDINNSPSQNLNSDSSDKNATSHTNFNNSDTTKTPDTGTMTIGQESSAIEFPWWMGVIFIVGAVALVWLFWPSHKKSAKKSSKKS